MFHPPTLELTAILLNGYKKNVSSRPPQNYTQHYRALALIRGNELLTLVLLKLKSIEDIKTKCIRLYK